MKAPGDKSRRFLMKKFSRCSQAGLFKRPPCKLRFRFPDAGSTQTAPFFLVTRWMTNHRMTTMMTV